MKDLKDVIVTERKNGSKRVQIKCDHKQLTDQSDKRACDINVIYAKYQKTGILPEHNKNGKFGDFSEVPTLIEAFEAVQSATELFEALPADIRKLMDNDASKLEMWLADDNNADLAIKYGLLEKKVQASAVSSDVNVSGGSNGDSTTAQVSTDNQASTTAV